MYCSLKFQRQQREAIFYYEKAVLDYRNQTNVWKNENVGKCIARFNIFELLYQSSEDNHHYT